jgi:superfamily II DNA/RNA helicase
MPDDPQRRRASSRPGETNSRAGRRSGGAGGSGRAGRSGHDARPGSSGRSGGSARPGNDGRPGNSGWSGGGRPGNGGRSGRPRNGRNNSPRPSSRPVEKAPSELDRALTAALAAPAPEPTTFAALGLPTRLVAALEAQGIEAPFAIQARALPDALTGRDVLGKAQTGSGKTLAFGLPALTRLAAQPAGDGQPRRRRPGAPRGLVLVPTRELAVQVADALEPLGRSLGLTVTTVYGGVSIGRQIDRLRRGVDLVVATPGRLIDLLDRRACTLDDIEISVLDEADHMADLGFMPAVTRILDATPAGGQRLLFSATLDRGVDRLVTSYLTDPAVCAVAPEVIDYGTAEHSVLVLAAADKVQVATEIAGRPARTLFFVRTKHGADRLARQFDRAGVAAAAIHGNLNQNQRQRALAGFMAGHPRVLVATDVAARGIHVDDIELVVHYDPPNDHKDYLHRSGRTARAGASGMVVALVEEAQVREVERMHRAAGISPARHQVAPGHEEVNRIATSGTPVPPPPPASAPEPAGSGHRNRPPARRSRPPRRPHSGPAGRPRPSGGAQRDSARRAAI